MSNNKPNSHEYEQMMSSRSNRSTNKNHFNYGILAVSVLALCGISFGLGISYQKSKQSPVAANTNSEPSITQNLGNRPSEFNSSPGGGPGNGQRPNVGEVSTISGNSITIKGVRSDSNQTFTITSDTIVQNNGSTASVSDIKTGDRVLITTDSSDTSTATQIMLNPSFGSPPGGGSGSL